MCMMMMMMTMMTTTELTSFTNLILIQVCTVPRAGTRLYIHIYTHIPLKIPLSRFTFVIRTQGCMLLSLAEATCAYRGSNKREEAPLGGRFGGPKRWASFRENDDQHQQIWRMLNGHFGLDDAFSGWTIILWFLVLAGTRQLRGGPRHLQRGDDRSAVRWEILRPHSDVVIENMLLISIYIDYIVYMYVYPFQWIP